MCYGSCIGSFKVVKGALVRNFSKEPFHFIEACHWSLASCKHRFALCLACHHILSSCKHLFALCLACHCILASYKMTLYNHCLDPSIKWLLLLTYNKVIYWAIIYFSFAYIFVCIKGITIKASPPLQYTLPITHLSRNIVFALLQ